MDVGCTVIVVSKKETAASARALTAASVTGQQLRDRSAMDAHRISACAVPASHCTLQRNNAIGGSDLEDRQSERLSFRDAVVVACRQRSVDPTPHPSCDRLTIVMQLQPAR